MPKSVKTSLKKWFAFARAPDGLTQDVNSIESKHSEALPESGVTLGKDDVDRNTADDVDDDIDEEYTWGQDEVR